MVPVSTNLCPNLSQLYGGNYPPATSAGQWNVPGPYGKTETYTFCDTTFPIATNFFGLNGGSINSGCNAGDADEPCAYQYWSEVSGEGGGLQSVVLPDGTVWGFAYDTTAVAGQGTYGDLTEVHLPSGGVLQYTYQNLQVCGYPFGESGFPLNRAVVQRVAKSISGPDIVTNYTYNPTQTIETDSSGNQTVHNFTLDNPGTMFCGASETSTQWFQGAASNSSTPLQEIDTTYHSVPDPQNLACPGSATVGGISAANCASPLGTYPTVTNRLPNNRTTQQNGQTIRSESYNYDQLFTDVQPWILDIVDYGQGAQSGCTWGIESSGFDFECSWASPDTSPFNLASISEPIYYGVPTVVSDGIKTTVTTRYAADHPAYQAVNLIDLPEAVTVCSSNGSECSSQAAAKTTYTYDGGGNTSLPKGNATSISRMISPSQSATTTQTFSPYGMITSTTDPIGNSGGANHTTSYKYDPTNNLYVISRTQPSTNGVAHVNYYQRDFNTGLLIAVTDENASSISDAAHSTNYTYDDAGRPTKVNYPDGGEVDVCVTDVGGSTCSKGSAPYQMFVTSQSSPSPDKVQRTTFDGLGRVIQTAMMSDPSGSDYVDSTYDSLGNLSSVSNPYRTTSFYLTTYGYDAIGRKTSQNQPGGTGSLGWSYSGNSVDSWDENRLHTRRQADLAGRITDVWEDSSGLNLHTQYLYDVLNNLTHVYQAGTGSDNPRTRTFTYDSLSRLLTANNPETGTVCYGTWSGASCIGGYDPNGNVITKTDARGVVTNYAYDGLNRLYAKTYTNAPAGTLSSCYQFDTAANGVGRLAVEWTQSGTCASTPPENFQSLRTYGAYDAMGRALTEQQCVAGFCTSAAVPSQPGPNCPTLSSATGLQYCYDLAGNLLAYSNGLTTAAAGPQYPQHALLFAQTFDSAGRLNSVTNSWPADPTHPQTLFSSPVYTPFNALSNWLLGTRLFTTRNYDSRLRVTDQSSVH
jgi:YD repeat-containing protein